MNTEQLRADFEAWARELTPNISLGRYPSEGAYEVTAVERAWRVWQAAFASPEVQKQPQYETQLQVWRSTDSCLEFWSWDEADQYDYDQALPENRRIIQIIKEG